MAVEYERIGLWIGLKGRPIKDSGFAPSMVWVHLDRVDAVSVCEDEEPTASWLGCGQETYRMAGRPREIIEAMDQALKEWAAEAGEP
jgi:hypothetical protein